MKAIDNTNLKDDLHYGPDCVGFEPALTYEINSDGVEEITITEASVFEGASTLTKVLVHITDVDGNCVHGEITDGGGSVVKDVSTLNTSNLSITATVITSGGCKADLGVYNLQLVHNATGDLEYAAKQGKRD